MIAIDDQTIRIAAPQFAPRPPYAAPPQFAAPQPYGIPQQYAAPDFGPLPGPPLPPAPKRSVGAVVAMVCSVIAVVAGIATAALFLLTPGTVDPVSVQKEIVRITQTAVGVVPTDIRCPAGVAFEAGSTFSCTATVDGQPMTYDVRQNDDEGNLTITYDRLVKVADVESAAAALVARDVEVDVTVDCPPAGRTVVKNAPGAPISCTATNAADPTDNAAITVTVDDRGTVAYTAA